MGIFILVSQYSPRSIDKPMALLTNSLIRKSLEFALKNYPVIPDYVKQHSQTMSEDVMRQHIELYVNNYSIDLGVEGKNAISVLYKTFHQLNLSGNYRLSERELFLS